MDSRLSSFKFQFSASYVLINIYIKAYLLSVYSLLGEIHTFPVCSQQSVMKTVPKLFPKCSRLFLGVSGCLVLAVPTLYMSSRLLRGPFLSGPKLFSGCSWFPSWSQASPRLFRPFLHTVLRMFPGLFQAVPRPTRSNTGSPLQLLP